MTLASMRRIDGFVGRPLCFVLSLFFRVFGRWLWRGPGGSERRVLFIELSEMGSTILGSPAVQRVRTRSPSRPPCFVILEKNAPSLRLLGLFDPSDIFTIRDDSLLGMAADVLRFIGFCRAKGIDTTVDFELFARISSVLSLLSCAGTRVGFDNFLGEGLYRGNHLTHRVQYNPYYHMSQNFLALIEALDADPAAIPLVKETIALPAMTCRVPVRAAESNYLRAEIDRCVGHVAGRRLVLFNHDAGRQLPIRSWPVARFVELARLLLDWDPGVVVVLVGIPDAAASAAEIVRGVGDARCVDFVGRTRTLVDLVQLFHQAQLLVTNDSGPAHFASLTDIPCITLFGPETARLYGPMGARAVNVDKGFACSPCLTALNHRNSPCTDNRCLQAITAAEVFAHATALLGPGAASRS